MMIYAITIAAVAAGLIIGAGSMVVARRSGATREQSVRRQRIVQGCILAIVTTMLILDAIDTEKHRYVNLGIVALAVGALVVDWLRGRRRRTLS